jgi:hypothetical protein
MNELGSYLLAAMVGALISAVIFASLWVCWMKRVQGQLKRLQRLMYDRPIEPVRRANENAAVYAANVYKKPELVAQFKVKDGEQTVSVLESEGKRFLRVNGELTWKERLKMLRYLKAEGFME